MRRRDSVVSRRFRPLGGARSERSDRPVDRELNVFENMSVGGKKRAQEYAEGRDPPDATYKEIGRSRR